MKKNYSLEVAGRNLEVEIGELAQLANGSALIKYGDTTVLSTATASSKPREGIDFFPLSVDYEEKMYALGKFPGGFLKREGRPTEHAILTARAIDRPMRPLFPDDLRNDVHINNLVLAVEEDNSADFCAMFGSSLAVSISDIPFNGPTASVHVGLVDDEIIINPNLEDREKSDLELTLAGTKDKVCMIEAGANEVSDEKMIQCIEAGFKVIQELCLFIESIVAEIGKEKFNYTSSTVKEDIQSKVNAFAEAKVSEMIMTDDKSLRDSNMNSVYAELESHFSEDAEVLASLADAFDNLQMKVVRDKLFKEHKRVDGRSLDQIRPLYSAADVIPKVHGSALFSRGQTQVLNIVTLAPMSDVQKLDGLDGEEYKRYMHQYNFPGYSVGEAKPNRSPGRREIGHGALAERSLIGVLPSEEDFPYAIRSVSEVLMSNGSTSQGSVCASSMALMDAGVPLKRHVAGISAGLIINPEDEDDYLVFMDIQGLEDFYGDMDFKVAGTTEGITGIQVDIKVDGLSLDIIKDAFAVTKKGRLQIISEVMEPAIAAPRENLKDSAPKILQTSIPVDKIGEVIGKGGKVINQIIEDTGAKVDIEEDGTVYVSSTDLEACRHAIAIVNGIVTEPEAGQVYEGRVTRLMNFGAFVEYLPGKEGLVHVSKISWDRVENVEDVLAVDDVVKVKVLEVDDQGRINLSIRDMTEKPEGYVEAKQNPRPQNRDSRSRDNNRNRNNFRRDRDQGKDQGRRNNPASGEEFGAKPRQSRRERNIADDSE